jgi:hypothetical protein
LNHTGRPVSRGRSAPAVTAGRAAPRRSATADG